LNFHRVIPGFVSQGGCPKGDGTGGPGYTIQCETEGNPHKHQRGSLSMAHAGKNTGGSQFFIVHDPQPHLDGKHTVFGQVTEGIDIVLAMRGGERMEQVSILD
ncbi:MAG: peptidylprolyl isomerase, partial [Cyanobacteria bacterium REEB65]|nr:peptidylprolyl isomerase [Cyanobacteria bacterium REEB65]